MFRNFLTTLRDSIYNPDFYEVLDGYSPRQAIAYFFMLSTLLALATTAAHTLRFYPAYRAFVDQGSLVTYFPADVTITVKGGIASSTAFQPLVLPMPDAWRIDDGPSNLIVIDTAATTAIASLVTKHDTFAALTRDSFIVSTTGTYARPESGEVVALAGFPDTTVNRESLSAANTWLASHPAKITAAFFVSVFAGKILVLPFYLVYFLFFAYLALVIARLFQHDHVSYRDAYIASIYSFTLPLMASVVLSALRLPIPFWLWGTVFAILILYMNWRPHFAKEGEIEDNEEDTNPS